MCEKWVRIKQFTFFRLPKVVSIHKLLSCKHPKHETIGWALLLQLMTYDGFWVGQWLHGLTWCLAVSLIRWWSSCSFYSFVYSMHWLAFFFQRERDTTEGLDLHHGQVHLDMPSQTIACYCKLTKVNIWPWWISLFHQWDGGLWAWVESGPPISQFTKKTETGMSLEMCALFVLGFLAPSESLHLTWPIWALETRA